MITTNVLEINVGCHVAHSSSQERLLRIALRKKGDIKRATGTKVLSSFHAVRHFCIDQKRSRRRINTLK